MHTVDSKVLADIRSEVCDTVLKWTTIIGSCGVALSFLRFIELGFLPVMLLHAVIVAGLASLYIFRKRVPYTARATVIIGVMVLVGMGGLLTFGSPARIEFFVAASIMSAVFFGERIGIAIAALGVALLSAIYILFFSGLVAPPTVVPPLSPTNWLTSAASMVVAALAPLLAVNRYRVHLNQEHRRLAEANHAKSVFLATMSHELRTPMTAILGMSDLLLADQTEGPARAMIARISKAGHLLLDLLNDVLDFSKIKANAVVIQPFNFAPKEMVGEICNLFRPLAAEKGVTLQELFAPDLSNNLVADAGRLRQCLLNVVGNAVKFTDRGSISVAVSENENAMGRWLKIEVADTGIGISAEQQSKLFQPFVQAEQGPRRRFGGTGLGLAISRHFAELMGGSLTLRSAESAGSTFTITIPVQVSAPTPSRTAEPVAIPKTKSLRILVADDDDTIRLLLQIMLQRWGHTVDCVANGRLAVEAVKSAAYDAVLMDMQMPEMDGAAATRAIRASEAPGTRLPIIAITADAGVENAPAYLATGVDALVTKPVNWHELSRLLHEATDTRARASSS
jgi:signal transduction histidine kinase/CheY-like chemotaxis protein